MPFTGCINPVFPFLARKSRFGCLLNFNEVLGIMSATPSRIIRIFRIINFIIAAYLKFAMYVLKEIPEDFIVEEVISLDLKDKGDYSYFLLEKTDWTTRNAIRALARRFRIKEKRFNIAGNKDRNAVTKQYVSVFKIGKNALERIKINGLNIKFIGFGDERLKLGKLEANKFEIVVRNLDKKCEKVSFIPNYFDEQRFSSKNPLIGKAFVKKDFKEACSLLMLDYENNDYIGALRKVDRWLLRFYLNSYQSYLFNEALKEYIRRNYKEVFQVDYSFGSLLFPKSRKMLNIKIPIPTYNTVLENDEIGLIYNEILEKENVILSDFKVSQMPELVTDTVYRDAFVKLNDANLDFYDDELHANKLKAKFSFNLPSGSYATIAVKACFADF